jgi:superfamily II DNA or RNA helicase
MVSFQINGNSVKIRAVSGDTMRVRDAIEPLMKYQPQGFQYSAKYKSGEWDGWLSLYHPWDDSFPRGFLEEVLQIVQAMEIPYEVRMGEEDKGRDIVWPDGTMGKTLPRPYQFDAIGRAHGMKRGIICLPTGTGKTLVAMKLIAILNKTTVIFVHKKELAVQWIKAMAKEYELPENFFGFVGDGRYSITPITLAMVQTASKLPSELFHGFGITIFDECHHVAAESIYDIARRCQSEYLLGLSATPYRADGKDKVLKGALGGFIVNLNVSDMIKDGYLSKPTFYLYQTEPKPYPRHMKYADVYRDYIVDNEERNAKIIKAAQYYRALGMSVYIHVKQIRHGEILHVAMPDSVWIHGRDKTDVRTKAIEDFAKNGGIMISTLLGEGVDVPGMNVLILGCGGQSAVFVRQLIGRVMRLTADKKSVTVIDFMDNARYLYDHAQERKALYESEPAFEVKTG